MAKLESLSHRKASRFKHSTKGWTPMRKLTTSLFFRPSLLAGVLTAPPVYSEAGTQSEQCDMMRGRQGGMMGRGGMMGGDGMMQGDRGGMMGRSGMMQGQEGMIGMMKQMSQMMGQ